jgi:uncharacterized protein
MLSQVSPGAGLEVLAIVGLVLFVVALGLVSWLAWRDRGCLGCLWVWLSVFTNAQPGGRSRDGSGRWGGGGLGGGGGFGGGAGFGGGGAGGRW